MEEKQNAFISSALVILQQIAPNITSTELSAWLEKRKTADTVPQIKDSMQRPYTRQEVAKLFGVSIMTIHRWITEGRLRKIKVGGRAVRITAQSVKALMEDEK